jgi:Flp pilus assembly protein TadD
LAVTALRHNEPSWAIEVLQSLSTDQPLSAPYCRTWGTACYVAGDYAAAEQQLRQSLVLDNTSALSYFLLGCTLSRQGRRAEAEPLLQEARRLDPRYVRMQ